MSRALAHGMRNSLTTKRWLWAMAALGVMACKVNGRSIGWPGGGGGASAPAAGEAATGEGGGEGDAGGGDDGAAAAPPASTDPNTIREVVTFAPAPGVPRIAATAPTWCDAFPAGEVDGWRSSSATQNLQVIKEKGWYWSQSRDVMKALCSNPRDPLVPAQTGQFLQLWANQTGLGGADLDAFLRLFAVEKAYDAARDRSCAAVKVSEEAGDRDRAFGEATRLMLGCGGAPYFVSGGSTDDLSWHYDRGVAPPSESLRAFVTLACLPRPDEAIGPRDLARYAVCGHDARALDPKALAAELARGDAFAGFLLRAQHHQARSTAAGYEAAARAQAAQDPAWKALLFDAPDRAWQAWTAGHAANQAAFAAAMAYEDLHDGPSRKARTGCWDRTWSTLTRYVAAQQARTARAVRGALTDTFGAVLLGHAMLCADGEGQAYVSDQLKALYSAARPARGPRYAAYFAVVDALGVIRAERARFPVELGWFGDGVYTEPSPRLDSRENLDTIDLTNDDPGGVVRSVRPLDDGVLVEFKTDRWKAATLDCKTTGRIIMWSGGDPVYGQDCTSGAAEWVESTHAPIWVPTSFAAGLAPGAFVRPTAGHAEHPGTRAQLAIPFEVWATKDRKQLVAHLGVAL